MSSEVQRYAFSESYYQVLGEVAREEKIQEFLFKNNFLSTDHKMYIVSRQTEQTVTLQKRETEKLVKDEKKDANQIPSKRMII